MNVSVRQSGLSIIEVIVALALSLIITLGLTQIFTSNSQSFRVSEASARIQETGRLATSIIGREIRNASYWGCLGSQGVRDGRLNSILNDAGFDVGALLRGLDAENDQNPGGSDVLYLGGVNGNSAVRVTFQPSQQAATMTVNDVSTLNENEIVIVTNCSDGDIFQITNNPSGSASLQVNHTQANNKTPGNFTQSLSTNYNDDPNGASVFKPRQQRFYLRDNNGRRELVTDGVNVSSTTPANIGSFSDPVALLQDIINFQVQFGVDDDQDGQVNSWEDPVGLTTAGRTQADNTIAVRLSVLVRSPNDGVTDGGQEYCFPGWLDCVADDTLLTTANANDTFLYRVYSTTITMRNRI